MLGTTLNFRKLKRRLAQIGEAKPFLVERRGKIISCLEVNPLPGQELPKNRPLVLLAHPYSKFGKFFFNESYRLKHYLSRGFRVILFDFNGFGESESIDQNYPEDIRRVIEHSKQFRDASKLIIHGLGFGATRILSALQHVPSHSVVILEQICSPPKISSRMSHFFTTHHSILQRMTQSSLKLIGQPRWNVAQKALQSIDRKDVSIIFIVSEYSKTSELERFQDLISYCTIPHKVISLGIQNAFQGPKEFPEEYFQIIDSEINRSKITKTIRRSTAALRPESKTNR